MNSITDKTDTGGIQLILETREILLTKVAVAVCDPKCRSFIEDNLSQSSARTAISRIFWASN